MWVFYPTDKHNGFYEEWFEGLCTEPQHTKWYFNHYDNLKWKAG